jgi:hypothetical protein
MPGRVAPRCYWKSKWYTAHELNAEYVRRSSTVSLKSRLTFCTDTRPASPFVEVAYYLLEGAVDAILLDPMSIVLKSSPHRSGVQNMRFECVRRICLTVAIPTS